MAGYKLQGKTASGDVVDIPLAATYDAAGHEIEQHYAAKEEYEAIMEKLVAMGGQLDLLCGMGGYRQLRSKRYCEANLEGRRRKRSHPHDRRKDYDGYPWV